MSVEHILIQALQQTLNELESTGQKRKVFSMKTVNTIRFTVGDVTAYGIYNGFREHDEAFRDIVKKRFLMRLINGIVMILQIKLHGT